MNWCRTMKDAHILHIHCILYINSISFSVSSSIYPYRWHRPSCCFIHSYSCKRTKKIRFFCCRWDCYPSAYMIAAMLPSLFVFCPFAEQIDSEHMCRTAYTCLFVHPSRSQRCRRTFPAANRCINDAGLAQCLRCGSAQRIMVGLLLRPSFVYFQSKGEIRFSSNLCSIPLRLSLYVTEWFRSFLSNIIKMLWTEIFISTHV